MGLRGLATARVRTCWCLLAMWIVAAAPAQDGRPQDGSTSATAVSTPAPAAALPAVELSPAEQITRLQRSIDADQAELARLSAALEDPKNEYGQAEADFKRQDDELSRLQRNLDAARAAGDTELATKIETELESTSKTRELSKERFDLAIESRDTARSRIDSLQRKIATEREQLAKLEGDPGPAGATTPTPTPAAPTPPPAAAPGAGASLPIMPGLSIPTGDASSPAAAAPTPSPTPLNERVAQAQQEADRLAAEFKEAEQRASSIQDRLAAVRETIALQERDLQNSQKKVDNAVAMQQALEAEYQQKFDADAPKDELREIRTRIRDAQDRSRGARAEVAAANTRINELQREIGTLFGEQLRAQQDAEARREAADEAASNLKSISNPFHPDNLIAWALAHGPRLAAIFLGIVFLRWFAGVFADRVVGRLARGSSRRHEDEEESLARAQTLSSVFKNASRVLILVIGVVMMLEEIGVPVGPLLGGAAVLSLAVAFGAQNLIRDYFTGFTILLENQYQINDVVKIAGIGGLVERITLRMTVLRDLEGAVHFIPNGQITTVTNLTHEWSRAVFEVGIAYNENVDRVIKIVEEEGAKMREDPQFRRDILADLEMLGLDRMADSAIVVKFLIKTRPLKQWGVKRAMNIRLKRRFDAESIEIPFPQRTIWHRYESAPPVPDWVRLLIDQREGGSLAIETLRDRKGDDPAAITRTAKLPVNPPPPPD
jgi:small conductance mechanosensitive channel